MNSVRNHCLELVLLLLLSRLFCCWFPNFHSILQPLRHHQKLNHKSDPKQFKSHPPSRKPYIPGSQDAKVVFSRGCQSKPCVPKLSDSAEGRTKHSGHVQCSRTAYIHTRTPHRSQWPSFCTSARCLPVCLMPHQPSARELDTAAAARGLWRRQWPGVCAHAPRLSLLCSLPCSDYPPFFRLYDVRVR